MKTVNFTEFRKNASNLISEVEGGVALLITRHGRPVAEVSPVASASGDTPSWKRPGLKLHAKGASLTSAILEERASEDIL